MRKGTYLFFIAFLAGVLIANFFGTALGRDVGAMGEYYMNRYLYMDITGRELFVYLFYERIPRALLLFLLCMGIGKWMIYGYLAYLGVSVGFLSVIAIINYGVGGILLMAGFLFPQWICYVLVCFVLYGFLQGNKERKREFSTKGRMKEKGILWVTFIMSGILLMLCGIYLESYINPRILKCIIRNI